MTTAAKATWICRIAVAMTGAIVVGCASSEPETLPTPTPPWDSPWKVFFDFDKVNLTTVATTTLKQVAADAKAGGSAVRIGVTGHTDRAGSDAYNMELSLRRANAVKDQLVRDGVPAASITVIGRGESQPLVLSGDGVREPQNRRVEIVMN